MAKRRKEKRFYTYECTITAERYKLTKKVDNQDDLVSIDAYYQLNPDKDDRPLVVKKRLGISDEIIEE
jgi:hypothetical protein